MLYASLLLAEKYDYLEEKFKKGYAFLRQNNLAEFPEGSSDLGDGIRAHVQVYETIPIKEAKFETHDCFIDIQYIVSGKELFGIANREGMSVCDEYNSEKDVTFYHDPACFGSVILNAGDLAVVPPEDAHKPCCNVVNSCIVKKIVIKIPI